MTLLASVLDKAYQSLYCEVDSRSSGGRALLKGESVSSHLSGKLIRFVGNQQIYI